jgi:hypothetical protein
MNQKTSVLSVVRKSFKYLRCEQDVSVPTIAEIRGGRNIVQRAIGIKAKKSSATIARKHFS